ncbi:MAG: alpha-amylase family glycosyl hydrolase, partial [Bacteroidota bacterium]
WGVDKYDYVGWDFNEFKQVFNNWHQALGEQGWVSPFLDNHDFSRMVSRWGNDGEYRVQSAKLLATLILTLRGTPSIYMGSEIGMTNVAFDSIEDYDDVETRNAYQAYKAAGKDMDKFMKAVHHQSRDNVRTPIQWDATEHAGFTTGTPWIKVNPNYPSINAEAVLADTNSIFYYYQNMLTVRRMHKTLVYGDFELIDQGSDQLFAYRRWDEQGEFFVYLNFSETELRTLPRPQNKYLELVIANYEGAEDHELILRPWEARVYRVG